MNLHDTIHIHLKFRHNKFNFVGDCKSDGSLFNSHSGKMNNFRYPSCDNVESDTERERDIVTKGAKLRKESLNINTFVLRNTNSN